MLHKPSGPLYPGIPNLNITQSKYKQCKGIVKYRTVTSTKTNICEVNIFLVRFVLPPTSLGFPSYYDVDFKVWVFFRALIILFIYIHL